MSEVDRVLDATELRCPLPLLKAKKALNEMEVGEVLEIRATDPGSERDFKVFAEQSSHEMLAYSEQDGIFTYVMRKGE